MSSSKPAYIFVGGVSHTPAFFAQIISEMKDVHGYESTAVAWPSCGANTEGFKHWDDVTGVQNAISAYIDGKNQDVVLVLHSYGGWPGSRAIKNLDKDTRVKNGKSTGIIEVVFLAAFLLPDNAPMANYSYLPPWLDVEDNCRRPNEQAGPLLFSDLSPSEQNYWLGQFEWQRNDFSLETLPDAPWHLPLRKTYVIHTEDKAATVEFQFKMLQGVLDETWTIKSINAGHEAFLSQPAKLAQVILLPSL